MGTYDFTYNVPANFNRRVVQFLQQFGKAHVAQAFQRCEYEYEDLGLAFYAGMKGDTPRYNVAAKSNKSNTRFIIGRTRRHRFHIAYSSQRNCMGICLRGNKTGFQ